MKRFFVACSLCLLGWHVLAQPVPEEKLAPGDSIRIKVYQNPDLSLDTNVHDNGSISFPLVRTVKLAGLTLPQAEGVLEKALQAGGFVEKPQVAINMVQARRQQAYVLGDVARPGQFPLERKGTRLSELLASAGGIAATGAPSVTISGTRAGQPMRQTVNLDDIFLDGQVSKDLVLADGDVLYVGRAPVAYIYGEAQRPGLFKLERHMTIMQALAAAGGPTPKGTERNLRVTRRMPDGKVVDVQPAMNDPVQPNDVIFVRETLF
jgi:polysaccharide biosynthesis/export protein